MTRRQFIKMTASVAGAAAVKASPALSCAAPAPLSPAINPVYLTGCVSNWPLPQLAAVGYRALELTPACLAGVAQTKSAAQSAGLEIVCVNTLPDLCPYLTGSLSDAVARNRRDSLQRLLQALAQMREHEIPLLVVAPSRLAM
jgi:hypothetical protein